MFCVKSSESIKIKPFILYNIPCISSINWLQNILNLCFIKKSINHVAFMYETLLALYENVIFMHKVQTISVADLHSKFLDACLPGSKFFQFHAVFGKFWQNHMLAPPGSWRPHLVEILDPPLNFHMKWKTRNSLHRTLVKTQNCIDIGTAGLLERNIFSE